jgi:hypothetical protein
MLGATLPVAAVFLYPDGGYLFHPDRWAYSKTSPIIEIQMFLYSVGIAIIPALLIVRHHRKKFGEDPDQLA